LICVLADVDFITIGQYFAANRKNTRRIVKFVTPEES